MRIYSKFHDYYDGVMYQGTDDDIVYRRFQEEAGVVKFPRVRDPWLTQTLDDSGKGYNRELKSNGKLVMYYDTRVATIFCGKVYMRYIAVVSSGSIADQRHMRLPEPLRFYASTHDELMERVAAKFGPFVEKSRHAMSTLGFLNKLPDMLGELNKIDWHQKHLELRSPVFSLRDIDHNEANRLSLHDRNYEYAMIVKNPYLQNQGFFQIMDAFTTYQELSMYLGGVMGAEARPMVTLPDIDKLVKAGFDKKTSFRKPKQNIG